jgi:hypothetical protein
MAKAVTQYSAFVLAVDLPARRQPSSHCAPSA